MWWDFKMTIMVVSALLWGGWRHTGSGWPVFALGISHCSQKHFRNVPQSDPLAPAQLTRWPAIGSSGGHLPENTACAIHSRSAVVAIVTRCLPHHSADTVTHSRLTAVTIPIAVKTQLWACWTMGASQNDEALFPGTSPWRIGDRCYTLGRFLFFSQVIGLRKFTG